MHPVPTPVLASPRCTRWVPCCATQPAVEAGLSAAGRIRRVAPSGVRRHRAGRRLRHHAHQNARRANERWLLRQRPEVLDLPAEHSDLMVPLARTIPLEAVTKRAEGLSVFLVGMRDRGGQLTVRPIRTMMNHGTTEVFFADLELPYEALIGEEGEGFRYLLDGLNAERILIAAECSVTAASISIAPCGTRVKGSSWAVRSEPTRASSFCSPGRTWRWPSRT